ncbi:MAG TPA: efflux RND transporter permease subunit [Chloroflexota bacterium]|nr:efflux RND transporter permease subunit [Chloroflexota bacterium]
MGLTRTAIQRPLATIMVFLALILLGQQAYTRLRVDRFPAITFPVVFAQISWPGASPEDVEQSILVPAENAVAGISGVQRIDSAAQEGSGRLTIWFVEGTDIDQATLDVQRRLAGIGRLLPIDATQPSVAKADPNSIPVMNVVLSGSRSPEELRTLAEETVQQRLLAVPGVADVTVNGGLQREIQVLVDYAKLEAYGLSLTQVSNALQRENVNSPGGRVDVGERGFSVRAMGLAQTPAQLGEYIVATTPRGPIRLRDVATIEVSYKRPTSMLRYYSHERGSIDAVGLTITKQADANTLETADNVRAALQQIRRTLPPGVEVTITNDTSRFVRRAVDAVQRDLILAIIITGVVLFLFLHTWRNTVIVLISIPTCLVSTFLLMYTMGFSINTITLMAMALMIGILVDDSIVVLENISRHLRLGEHPMEAALKGRSEIGLAAIAITLTDVVVYVPISFMQGNIGKLFREFGLTIASATLLSLLVSFTLVPVLASRWLKAHEEEGQSRFARAWERGFDRLAAAYRRLLAWALHHRPVVVAVAAAALIASLLPLHFNLIGQEYAPNEDDGQFTINTEMPPGTSLAGNSAAIARIEEGLLRIPEVESFTTTVGQSGSRFGGTDRNGQIAVQLVEKTKRQRSVFEVMQEVRRLEAEVPGMRLRANVQSPLIGGGGSTPINIRLTGDNIQTLQELAAQVEQIVRNTPGTVDIRNDAAVGEPEVRAFLDRQRMADLGVTASQVANALRTAIGGNTVTQLRVEGQSGIDITVLANRDLRNDLTTLANIPIPVGAAGAAGTTSIPGIGSTVRLGQVADLRVVTGPTSIARSDRQRQVSVQANLVGRSVGDAAREIRAELARLPMPAGYRWTFIGQVDQLDRARDALLSALAISVILIYMLLVALYESWLHPLAIMFSLPVALVGALGGLLLTGNTLNVFSMIGMIMLMGLVAKNAILLVDFTNMLRAEGLPRLEALLRAGPIRLRPIIMTTATVVFAMIPLALKLEEGGESRAPMAVVLIGGVLTSTLLTLVLVPVMYTYLDDLSRVPALARARVPGWLRLRRRAAIPAMAGGANGHPEPRLEQPRPSLE